MSDSLIRRKYQLLNLKIANAQANSDAIQVQGFAAGSMTLPAALTGTTFTVQASSDGVTFTALYQADGTTAVSFTVAASHSVFLPPECFGSAYIRFVSGSNEGAARNLIVELTS
jgi:hypothetical protein